MLFRSRALAGVVALGVFAGCSDDASSSSDTGDTNGGDSSGSSEGTSGVVPPPGSGPDATLTTGIGETTGGPGSGSSVTTGDAHSTTDGGSTSGGSTSVGDSSSTVSTGAPSTGVGPDPVCGDGVVDDDEECDDGPGNADDADCTSGCTINVCGDGFQHGVSEACDDGNEDDLDACRNDCSAHEVVQLALGGNHTCVLLDSGNVKCWGLGSGGRLGYGNVESIGDDDTPADVGFVSVGGEVEAVVAGVSHTCVVLVGGGVRCFGPGAVGQLGYGNTQPIGENELPSSVGLVSIGDAVTVLGTGGGAFHSCAQRADGEVRCWGEHVNGKLGVVGLAQSVGDDEVPSAVSATEIGGVAVQLAAGSEHSCALLENGSVRCWGSGANAALGYGNINTIGDDETPASAGDVQLSGVATEVATGWLHTCALLEGGDVQCWGRGNDGRLGYGNTAFVGAAQTPDAVGAVSLSGVAQSISAGLAHSCALLTDGTVQCWGLGSSGQLGYGNTESIGDDETPDTRGVVPLPVLARAVAADAFQTCVITEAGAVKCWGNGGEGRLGYGNTDNLGDDESLATLPDVPLFPNE